MRTDKRMDARWTAPKFRAASFPLLVMLVAASASGASPDSRRGDDASRISVTAVAGQVDVTMAGEAVTVERDATVLLPARIVTGRDGTLGLTQAGTNISVSSNTDVEIPAEAVDGNLVARLVQHRGNVFYDVAPRDVGKLRVETPFLVAVIKGTQFNVAVDDDGTTISLFEGRLELRTPDDSDVFELNAGEIAIRSLIDDSIRIVGMNDESADAARIAEPLAEDAASAAAAQGEPEPVAAAPAAPRQSDSEDRVAANDAAVAGGRAKTESGVVTTGIEALSVAGTAAVEPGPALVALDRRNDQARDRGTSLDLDLSTVEVAVAVDVGSADIGLDVDVDAGGGGLDVALEGIPDVDGGTVDLGGELDLGVDTNVELGGVLDLDTDLTVDPSLDLGVDTGLDVAAPGLDLDVAAPSLDLDVGGRPGTLDVGLPDVAKPLPVTTPRAGLAPLL